MAGCVFCRIIAGGLPAHRVLEDETFVAFLDTRPLFHGHVLLVPRLHITTFEQLPAEFASQLVVCAQRLERAVESAMESDGSLLIVNNVVSQSVPHLHLHVIPRTRKDGLRLWLGPRHPYRSAEQRAETGRLIRVALDREPPVA